LQRARFLEGEEISQMKRDPTKPRVYGPIENCDGAFEIMAASADGLHLELARVFISRESAERWLEKFPEEDARDEDKD
jgi:hypothetical protein